MSEEPKMRDETILIPISMIRSSPTAPREVYDEIEGLAQTIEAHGLIQPIVVRKLIDKYEYEVIVGERRLRACQIAGLKRIPCMLRNDLTEDQVLEMQLIENLQRRDLQPFEKVRVFQTLRDRFRLTQRQIAEKVGLSVSRINDYLSLEELPPDVQSLIETKTQSEKALTVQKAQLLVKSDLPPEKVASLADTIKKKGFTTKELAKKIAEDEPAKIKRSLGSRKYWRELTRSLKEFANYWDDYSQLKEWETVDCYHLELHVSMPKDLQEEKETTAKMEAGK